jgi:hypothetical protein
MKTISTLSFCICLGVLSVSCGHQEDGKVNRPEQ